MRELSISILFSVLLQSARYASGERAVVMARDIMTTDDAVLFRLRRAEEDIKDLQTRLNLYVPANVNDLRISNILEATTRISAELQDVKTKVVEQQERTAKIQINVLKGTVGTFVSLTVAILVGYITHFFH